MAKITWSVPLLQYGKFMIEADEDELGVDVSSPHSLGMAYAVFAQLAAKGYDEGLKIDVDPYVGVPGHVTDRYQESSEERTGVDALNAEHEAEAAIKTLGATTVEPWTINPPKASPKDWEEFNVEEF